MISAEGNLVNRQHTTYCAGKEIFVISQRYYSINLPQMKKSVYVLLFCLSCAESAFSLDGTGTITNPYRGTVASNTTLYPSLGVVIDGIQTIYATDIQIINNSTLSIAPGGLLTFYGINSPYTLTIGSGCTLIIQPNALITVNHIINNGILRMESSSSERGSSSLMVNNYTVAPTAITEIQMFQPGGQIDDDSWWWHYISVPISNITTETFDMDGNPYTAYDLAQYIEPLVVDIYNESGWVTYDGYQYHTENTLPSYTFSTLSLGKGFNFYSSTDATILLTTNTSSGRTLNTSASSIDVTCGSNPVLIDYSGYNLIGNPFTSFIDWDQIFNNNYLPFLNRAIYFTVYDGVGSYVYPFSVNGGTGKIPPMQGFFVKATGPGSIPLPLEARTHKLRQLRLKGAEEDRISSDTVSFIRLKIENEEKKNELVVYFNEQATNSFDGDFDAYKMGKTNGNISIWTKIGNVDYSINGLPFPETSFEIPVGINVKTQGIYKLSSDEFNKLDNYSVTLKDKLTNFAIDLKKGEVMQFDAPSGISEDRFILSIANLTTDIPAIITPERKFSIYSSHGTLNILSLSDEFGNLPGSVKIYDLTGRKVLQVDNLEWNGNGDLKQFTVDSAEKGLFIVEVKAGNKKYVEKVTLNR